MAMFLIFLPAVILSGFMYPIKTMPAFFQALTLLNPVRHFLEIVRGIFLKGEGVVDLWPLSQFSGYPHAGSNGASSRACGGVLIAS